MLNFMPRSYDALAALGAESRIEPGRTLAPAPRDQEARCCADDQERRRHNERLGEAGDERLAVRRQVAGDEGRRELAADRAPIVRMTVFIPPAAPVW
jgi:hypothetical protein